MNHTERARGLTGLLQNLGLELSFTTPGKDIGLLPVNSFLMQVEELLHPSAVPEDLIKSAQEARKRLDRLFDTTAVFDKETIEWLMAWSQSLRENVEGWAGISGTPPAATLIATSVSSAAPAGKDLPPPAEELGQNLPTPPHGEEPVIILNLESDRDLLREFVNESQEHLQNIEQGVLVLEEQPTNADTLNSIFRAFHTFKGGSGFLNLTAIKDLAHELESLLDAARRHQLAINSEIIDVILEGGDTLRQFVNHISARMDGDNGAEPILVPTLALVERVRCILDGGEPRAAVETPVVVAAPPVQEPASGEEPAPTAGAAPTATNSPTEAKPGVVKLAQKAADFVKVDTLKLDSLIDLVGELVIAESMVMQDSDVRSIASSQLMRNIAQLRRITSELQRTAMSLRMVPIRATFQKMTRLVRDLAARSQKQIHLALSGEDTELDRNIVEAISDPLIHMIRNAADHGIERPESRMSRGKPAGGTIHLRAFHQGGNIVIEIQDDGNGLNTDRILSKARERGLIRPEQTLSEKEIHDLIFAPGFSTADTISDISGRGVGMDVVRRNIEKLRGKVDINTIPGQGTTFTIYLPLTLAIIDGMIVSIGTERYIIPTLSVRESFRPRPEMISTVHERGEMVNVRGRLCPLLRLYQFFDQPAKVTDPSQGIIVVVESGQQTRCLMVDELIGKQEVVIKSLGDALKKNKALAGGAVLGDGRVGLILDVDSLVRLNVHSMPMAA